MAETSIFGIQSGFDTADVVSKLIQLQGRPIELKLAQVELEEEKLNAFQDLKSQLQVFKNSLASINTESRFISNKGEFSKTSGDGDVVEINPTSLSTSGSFTLEVTQLAKESKITSAGFESITSEIQQGIFEIKVGDKTTFIQIDSSNNSLDGLRLAINNSGADVQASFINDGSGSTPVRLLLSGTKTGAENSVTARLFTSSIGTGEFDAMTFTETQTAQDALLKLDGIDIVKSSNTVNDVVQGTILNLVSIGSGTIEVKTDREEIKTKIFDFVDGYNQLFEFLRDQLTFDEETLETGLLFGNFMVQNLQNTLRSVTTGEIDGLKGANSFLAQIGITTQSDGTLIVDSTKLDEALLGDSQSVAELFASKGIASNSAVTFVGFTDKTQAGSFEVRVLGGVPQLRKIGEPNFTNATGTGNFFAGAEGTSAEGLNFRIGTSVDGDYGTIDLTMGVAEQLNSEISALLDTTQNGPLESEIKTVTNTIDDLNETIFDMDERLELFEQNIRDRFINLELILGRLNTQRQAFSNSIESIKSAFNK